jgi:ferredoxin
LEDFMTIKQLDPGDLNGWVEKLLGNQTVIAPVARDDRFVFEPLGQASDLRLDYDITVLPPKKYLLPPQEVLATFKKGKYQSTFETKPFVLFGVHPYDMAAIRQMDKFFAGKHEDEHYMVRREACTIVVLDVETPSRNHFAGNLGTAVSTEGGDLLLSKIKDGYLAEAHSAKGRALLKSAGKLKDATEQQIRERKNLWESNRQALRKHKLKGAVEDISDLLKRNYDHPVWKEKAALCLSCGACNIVCPTCYCFDIQDDLEWDLECGTRCRSWDGCLLKDFANVAGGHNFRKNSPERFRHRLLRKGKYLPELIGELSCVGCGRCIDACVPKVSNPVEILNKLWGE